LREDIGLLRQACYCANLVEQATETDTPLAHVFDLVIGLLGRLLAQPLQAPTIYAFELKLLTELGLRPDLDTSNLNPGTKQLVKALTENDWQVVARLRPTAGQAAELGRFLHGFLIYHLGRIPNGRDAALGIGET
jgi:recombinational DNA repair protein (RecF pathway)